MLSPNEAAAAFREMMERAWDLDGLLAEIERQARAVLEKPKRPRAREDADTLLLWVEALRKRLTGSTGEAATLALKTGALAERAGYRHLIPYARRALRAETELVASARKRGRPAAEVEKALSLFDKLRREKPSRKLTSPAGIYHEVKSKTGIPPRALRRYLKARRDASA